MAIKLPLPRLFADEEDEELRIQREATEPKAADEPAPAPAPRWLLPVLAAGALATRLFCLFFLTDPENAGDGWHGDVYHHWQIAYLTKQIGLWAPDGPRLWDLKGLDYFWGVLHPTLMLVLFYLTGSIDIVLARLLSVAFSILVVVLIFELCRRYWNLHVALAAAAFAALVPTSVFVDSTGFLEPLGVGLCLLGIWLFPKRGFWAGVSFGLAAMARAEAWIFSLGMLVASAGYKLARSQRLPMVLAWAALIGIYMKILLDRTGNPIYPVWWNFLANAWGNWEYRPEYTSAQLAIRPWLGALLVASAIALALVLWKRPRSYMLLSFGFGYLVFTAGMLGFTAYLKSWESWFWMERFFVFPYEFVALLAAVGLFWVLPKRFGRRMLPAAWLVTVLALAAVQLEWSPILSMYDQTRPEWANALATGENLGAAYNRPPYAGNGLAIPEADPDVTYALARYGNVDGKHIVGELYDPFYYTPPGYSYRDHPDTGATLMRCWLTKENVRLLAFPESKANYRDLVADHQGWFPALSVDTPGHGWVVVGVDVPQPTPAECAQAAKDSQS
jgi:hypothetical protein